MSSHMDIKIAFNSRAVRAQITFVRFRICVKSLMSHKSRWCGKTCFAALLPTNIWLIPCSQFVIYRSLN